MASIIKNIWDYQPKPCLHSFRSVFDLPCYFQQLSIAEVEKFMQFAPKGMFFFFSTKEGKLYITFKNQNRLVIYDLNYDYEKESFTLLSNTYHKNDVNQILFDFKEQFLFPLNCIQCTPH